MALFDTGAPTTLEQALGDQAQNQIAGLQDAYTQNRRKLISQQAASGRLQKGSGVSNYNLTDLATGEAGQEADVYNRLASSLGMIPAEDTLNANDYNRNLGLAKLIGSLNK